jgi:hypothetical protein
MPVAWLALHVLAAVLATWRLTDLLAYDTLAEPLRVRCSWAVLRCPRCLSVWAGIASAVVFLTCPWVNYPLALAWCYVWRVEILEHRRQRDALAQENARLRTTLAAVISLPGRGAP